MSIAIIINPMAGRVSRASVASRAELASAVAERHGHRADVFVTERGGHARELAAAAVRRGAHLVVAWGGDGTINEVVSALVGNERVAMAIMPAGSGNGLARALGIDPRPEVALADALAAAPRCVDVGEIGGRCFANVAGIGFDAHVAAQFNARRHHLRGLIGYTLQTAKALPSYTAREYEIVAGEWRWAGRALLVVLANGVEFGNRIRIAPHARLDDGALDLVIVTERSRLVTLWNMRRLVTGSIERAPVWSSRRVSTVTIACAQPMMFHVDGEPIDGDTELRASIRSRALRICARPSSDRTA